MKYLVIAMPSARGLNYGAKRQVAGPFEKSIAANFAREMRARKVFGKVFLEIAAE